jgi:SAM-dependent methyltransferase
MDVVRRMRDEWNRRAREDANFYVGFGRRGQDEEEFLSSAAETVAKIEGELTRLPPAPPSSRRALEIGCGPGRLMLPLSRHFGEIHGIDVSDEMVAIARGHLAAIPNAYVHLGPGDALSMFAGEFFDFVYSYIVFQHIPEREMVLSYLRESRRVLKPTGVLCCQLRGAPPLRSEMERETTTWTGCYFSGEEIAAFSCEQDFPLVALTGVDTQYLWTTWVKPPAKGAADDSQFVLKAVTSAENAGNRVPSRGPGAAVSLWIDGFSRRWHLGNLEVMFEAVPQRGCYLSPVDSSGACQLNARLPEGIPEGPMLVSLRVEGRRVGDAKPIAVIAAPGRQPKVLSVTDGVNLLAQGRTEHGGVKVTLQDIERPQEVSFDVAGRPVEYLQFERRDPITDTYEFAFHVHHKTRRGQHPLRISVSGRELSVETLEVARGSPAETDNSQDRHEHHGRATGPEGGAQLGAAVKPKSKIARTLTRWFHDE